jgi:L-ribulose-5-phosphate 3-epimerase
MMCSSNRRDFLGTAGALAAGLGLTALASSSRAAEADPPFRISLAEWSFHRALFGKKMDHLDFAKTARQDFAIEAIEYVNQFFKDKAQDMKYLGEMKQRAADQGVRSVLIMIDDEGDLGDPDAARRTKAVENHHPWLEAAKYLGCHAIRVNARSRGSYDEQRKLAADGLRRLAEFGASQKMNVIVENHGGLSSNGVWLSSVIRDVNLPNCGTLPDFGNFELGGGKQYDRYKGVAEMMPFAKAVSAKSHDFDEQGNETHTDFKRMMKIVVDAGYHGFVGIEYEGDRLPEAEGVRATKKLLLRVRKEMSS